MGSVCLIMGGTLLPLLFQYVYIVKSKQLWDIGKGEKKMVYDCSCEGAVQQWFAPELHRIGDAWYIYGAPDYGDNLHTMTVLVSWDDTPMGEYTDRGMVKGLENQWTIDGTVITYKGELYFVWSNCRAIYLSKMSDPCTLTGPSVILAKPELDFEMIEGLVNEGPAVLYRGNKIHIVYSGNDSRCDDYCLGLLTFTGDDILDAKQWVKFPRAVFKKTDHIFGPGHCSFTTVKEGGRKLDYIVYHANVVPGTGWSGRNVFIQPFEWNAEDYPIFGRPMF